MDKLNQQAPVPLAPEKSHGSKIMLFIFVVEVILIGVGEYVLEANKTQAPLADNVIAQPSPTPIDETVNWKTYRNEKYVYELKYPSFFNIFGIKEYDGYTQFTDGAIDLTVNNYSIGVDQRILNTEEIKIGGENAKKYNHILEEFPDQVGFTIVQFSHNNKEFTITLQSRDQKPLSEDQIKTFDKILSTFKFTHQSQVVDTSSWKTYTNIEEKWSIKYPNDMIAMSLSKTVSENQFGASLSDIEFANKNNNNSGAYGSLIDGLTINVLTKSKNPATSVKEIYQKSVRGTGSGYTNYTKEIVVNGINSYQIELMGEGIHLITYLPFKDAQDKYIFIRRTSAGDSIIIHNQTFDQILSTFQFTDQ